MILANLRIRGFICFQWPERRFGLYELNKITAKSNKLFLDFKRVLAIALPRMREEGEGVWQTSVNLRCSHSPHLTLLLLCVVCCLLAA